jgi:predicted thioesterase
MVTIGIKGTNDWFVTKELSAMHIGSVTVPVLATPMMIALMEKTCRECVKPYLEPGQETVGMDVHCEVEVTDVDRRRISFKVAVYDKGGLVGEGIHERFIIDVEKFQEKTEERKRMASQPRMEKDEQTA